MAAIFDLFRHLLTNGNRDPFRVYIVARKNKVRGWSCASRIDAEITARAWLDDHPGHSHALINGERFDREARP